MRSKFRACSMQFYSMSCPAAPRYTRTHTAAACLESMSRPPAPGTIDESEVTDPSAIIPGRRVRAQRVWGYWCEGGPSSLAVVCVSRRVRGCAGTKGYLSMGGGVEGGSGQGVVMCVSTPVVSLGEQGYQGVVWGTEVRGEGKYVQELTSTECATVSKLRVIALKSEACRALAGVAELKIMHLEHACTNTRPSLASRTHHTFITE
eukprot:1160578-Pelagomonas_calceolata.AAC.2